MGKGLEEREINLWDLFWAVCLKWRSILVCAVICTILAGGFSYIKSIRAVEAQQKAKEEATEVDLEELAAEFSDTDRYGVEMYIANMNRIEEQEVYNASSPLMALNPEAFYKGELSYYVDNHFQVEYPLMAKNNNIVGLVNMYKSELNTEDIAEGVRRVLKLERDNLYSMDMIDCDNVYGNKNSIDNNYGEGIITISVYAADEKTCTELMSMIREQMEDSKAAVTAKFGEHDVTLLRDVCKLTMDVNLQTYQRTNQDKIQTYLTNMKNAEKDFTDEQKAYLDAYKNQEDVETGTEQQEEQQADISKKLVFLGFLGGAFLMFVIWALLYIFSSRIRLEDNFEQIFGSKLLGNVPLSDKGKKKWFGFIDRIFENLRHLNQRYFEKGEALDMVVTNIRIALKNTEHKKLVITGSMCDEEEKLLKELSKRLNKEGVEIVSISSVLYNSEALEEIVDAGQVVLVERVGKTLYQEVQREIEICAQQKVNIIGCVVVY